MKTITLEILKRVKNVSVQAAGLGFGAEWEKRIGLVYLRRYIKKTWRSYKVRRIPTPARVHDHFRGGIDELVYYFTPRLQNMAYLRYLPQLIPLLQTLYHELIELIKFDVPDESINGHFRMMTATEKMLERVNSALAQVAEWGFGKEWEERVGLVRFRRCIIDSWRFYRNVTDTRVPSLWHLKHIHRTAIAGFVEFNIPRLQQPLDAMNTYLHNLPQVIPLLQTLYIKLSELTDVDKPEDSMDGYNCMLKVTEKMMKCVNTALAQVAEWGVGKEWEERIGLVWFKQYIIDSWLSYHHEPNSQIPSLQYLQVLHRQAIAKFAEYCIPQLQKSLDGLVSASVWHVDWFKQ